MKERYKWKAVRCTAFLLISGIYSLAAQAQVSISPVRLDLSDERTKDVILVGNQQEKSASYQVEVVAWTQSDERREVYSPTEDILAVPPLFTIEPGEEQIVRVGMLTGADLSIERSYRMFISELADPQEDNTPKTGVNMRLRLGIPIFVAPTALPHSSLDYIDADQMGNHLFMQVRNSGNTHVRISEIRYQAPDASDAAVESAAIYVLAGHSGFIPVVLPDSRRLGNVTLVTDTLGTLEYELSPAN